MTDDGRGNGDGGSTGPAEGRLRYHRILLKLSGEALLGDRQYGVDPAFCAFIARQVAEVHATGVQVGIVVGGGNIFRGLAAAARGMDRATGDYIGMLATVMNGLALQDAIERIGVPVRVMSAIAMNEIAEPYIRRRAVRHLEKGRVAIFVAGTGNPYFTTDTAAALRAVEIGAEVLLKATKVDGVYDADPMTSPNATRYERLGYQDLLRDQLKVLDAAAVSLCLENDLPIVVFDLNAPDNISEGCPRRAGGYPDLRAGWRSHRMTSETLAGAERKMQRAVEVMERDFQGLRTGRASTSLVERLVRRLLRHADAAQPARVDQRPRVPPDRDPAVGPRGHRRDREGDPEERHRPHARTSTARSCDSTSRRSPRSVAGTSSRASTSGWRRHASRSATSDARPPTRSRRRSGTARSGRTSPGASWTSSRRSRTG